MTRRPRSRPTELDEKDDGKVISLSDAGWRFRWIERDIREMKTTIESHGADLKKINRNLLIVGCVIIGLGVGSRILSNDVISILSKVLGVG